MQDFRNLKVWRKSHQLTVGLYKATKGFAKEEIYGLTSQVRRSASSIGPNIAEGCGRGNDADMGRFLQMVMGSACELEHYLLLRKDLEMMRRSDDDQASSEVIEIKRMLSSLFAKVRAVKTAS